LTGRHGVSSVRLVRNEDSGERFRGTTILAVRRGGVTVVAGDGQVSLGNQVVKATARKVRRLAEGRIVVGFAGGSADAITLFERLENQLRAHGASLARAAVELAKEWRTDRVLRRLEAMLLAVDGERIFLLSGTGDIIEPDGDCAAVGSGGPYALAAARALLENTELGAADIAGRAMAIAADICVFTNRNIIVESVSAPG
jgi:ATP-dependent HslUV protease, peptidase subunit HslV